MFDAVLFDLGGVWLQDGDFSERSRWAQQRGLTSDELFEIYLTAVGPGWEGGRTEEGISKPDPRIYLSACERLGVEPRRAVFVDDKHRNVVGARAVGMHAIEFTSPTGTVAQLRALLGIR